MTFPPNDSTPKSYYLKGLSDDELQCIEYEKTLVERSSYLLNIYTYSETPILCLGVIGHSLSLLTLFKSPHMQTPSFLYHKLMTACELLYVLNCFVQTFLDARYGDTANVDQGYSDYTAAIYLAIVNRIVGSVTGYVILYMILLIAFDRLLALHFYAWYRDARNKRRFAIGSITIAIVLSCVLNSWASAFENVVVEICGVADGDSSRTDDEGASSLDFVHCEPNETYNVRLYKIDVRSSPKIYLRLRAVKDLYNSVIRIAYPIILTVVTIAVIHEFLVQRRRRRKLRHDIGEDVKATTTVSISPSPSELRETIISSSHW